MYGKIFASTFTGSMFGAGPDVFAVWGYVLAHTVDSTVELNPTFLAAVLGMEPERVELAIAKLTAPDSRSRNPENDGRRLVHERGFQYHVTSHEIYRNIRNDDERREYNREAQRRSRAKSMTVKPVIDSQRQSAMSAHTESESEAEPLSDARWTARDWYRRFGDFWAKKKNKLIYGKGGDRDSKAVGELGEILADIADAGGDQALLALQNGAKRMFALYLGDTSPDVVKAEHPWSWFVTRFNGLMAKAARGAGADFHPSEVPS